METVPPLSAGVVSGPQASLDVAGVVTSLCGVPVTLVESVSPVTLAAAPGQGPYAKGYGAVLRSLARASPAAKLLGATPFEEGNVDSWVEFAMLELSAHTDDIPDAALVAGALTHPHVALEVPGQTLDGRDVDLVTVGKGKLVAWLIARQHPGESMAGWFVEGIVDKLCDAQDPVTRGC